MTDIMIAMCGTFTVLGASLLATEVSSSPEIFLTVFGTTLAFVCFIIALFHSAIDEMTERQETLMEQGEAIVFNPFKHDKDEEDSKGAETDHDD